MSESELSSLATYSSSDDDESIYEDPVTVMELREYGRIDVGFNSETVFINSDLKTKGSCFEFAEYEYKTITEFLSRDIDNIVIINVDEELAICYSREVIRAITRDRSSIYKECIGRLFENGDRTMGNIIESKFDYIKLSLSLTGSNTFVPAENLEEALSSRERIFCLIPLKDSDGIQLSLSHTASYAAIFEEVRIGANHCQRGSNILLHKLVKCRFSKRAPKWTMLPPTLRS